MHQNYVGQSCLHIAYKLHADEIKVISTDENKYFVHSSVLLLSPVNHADHIFNCNCFRLLFDHDLHI